MIVRKAYGAGLYAMAGPAFDPDCTLALPTAKIAVMGPSAAVNAVFYNQLAGDRGRGRAGRPPRRADGRVRRGRRPRCKLASEMVIDAIVQPEDLRAELVRRFARYAGKVREWPAKRNAIPPA